MRWIFIFFITLAITDCKKGDTFPDVPIVIEDTRVLAHRGGGTFEGTPNSFEAVVYGFEHYDGVEVDIQMSSNNTIWVSHDAYIDACDSWAGGCFNTVSDDEISRIDSCSGLTRRYTRLDEVLAYMQKNYPEKHISLDVKFFDGCSPSLFDINAMYKYYHAEFLQITAMLQKYDLVDHTLIESEITQFLDLFVETNQDYHEYLSIFDDFDKGTVTALQKKYDGISYKNDFLNSITADHINLVHQKGLRIQVWTTMDSTQLAEIKSINPDYIQSEVFR
ncbi:MAG: glycerophosphodiester phosphodiesterase family protein [Bacteroidota bacterium]|nr:glycerophosphodiester phosphodiesterase family protein [Bacteroidota bacterium]